jgi:hypothetical protein
MLKLDIAILSSTLLGFYALPAVANEASSEFENKTSNDSNVKILELPTGTFSIESRWTTAQQTADEIDVLAGKVSFLPKRNNLKKSCNNISFIQTARVLNNQGLDYQWPSGQHVRNAIRTIAQNNKIQAGYFVDHDASACHPKESGCSPFFRDSWPNSEEGSQDGSFSNKVAKKAVLIDYPFGWDVMSSISLEACAVCRDNGEYWGCATWGGTWPMLGARFVHIPEAAEQPTETFESALKNFWKFYRP